LATVNISPAPASHNFCPSEIPRFSAAWSDAAEATDGEATMAACDSFDQASYKHTIQKPGLQC